MAKINKYLNPGALIMLASVLILFFLIAHIQPVNAADYSSYKFGSNREIQAFKGDSPNAAAVFISAGGIAGEFRNSGANKGSELDCDQIIKLDEPDKVEKALEAGEEINANATIIDAFQDPPDPPEGYSFGNLQCTEDPTTRKEIIISNIAAIEDPDELGDKEQCELDGRVWTEAGECVSPGTESDAEEALPSCETEGGSFSWMACPLIRSMLGAIEGMSSLMSSLLETQPLVPQDAGGTNTPIFTIWQGFRNIAFLFIAIAFLVAIFGQALSFQIFDAYTMKRMIPRIALATMGIILSFYICAIFLDVFNVFGKGVQNLVFSALGDIDIQVAAGGKLAGGILGAIGVGGIAVVLFNPATLATIGLILLPVITAFVAAFAVIILRHIVIIMLVILSPIAFATWVLPNTEEWFKRWRSTFMTMLLMYPFVMLLLSSGVVFAVVITNGGNPANSDTIASGNFINYLLALAGLGVSVGAIPFTIKAASGVLSNIAGKLNDPNRGLVDKTRKSLQGVRERNKAAEKSDLAAKLRGNELGRFRKPIARIKTGTLLGKYSGGGRYADLHRTEVEAQGMKTETRAAFLKAKGEEDEIKAETLRLGSLNPEQLQKAGMADGASKATITVAYSKLASMGSFAQPQFEALQSHLVEKDRDLAYKLTQDNASSLKDSAPQRLVYASTGQLNETAWDAIANKKPEEIVKVSALSMKQFAENASAEQVETAMRSIAVAQPHSRDNAVVQTLRTAAANGKGMSLAEFDAALAAVPGQPQPLTPNVTVDPGQPQPNSRNVSPGGVILPDQNDPGARIDPNDLP